MTAFRFYSVKLLPVSGRRDELVGSQGYKKLFEQLSERISAALKSKSMDDIFYGLRNEFYLSVLHVHIDKDISTGAFIKFDAPDHLVNTFTGRRVQEVPEDTSAHRHEFFFVFDFEKHILAVQTKGGRLPSPSIFTDALRFFLEPVAENLFPEHTLKIDQLTSDEALNKVFETAEKYRRVQVEISLSNTDEYIDDEISETEKELEELGITELEHTEKAANDGFMTNISKKCRHYLIIAKKNGNATIRYLEMQTQKVKTFVMRDNPLQLIVRPRKNQPQGEYVEEIRSAISEANARSLKAE